MPQLDDPAGWEAVALAAKLAAERLLEVGGSIGEVKHQQPFMREELSALEGWRVDESESTLTLAGWCHDPGGTDVMARDPAGRRWIGELKLRKTDECLWDLLKVADGLRRPDVAAGYLLVGSKDRDATVPDMCRELLVPGRARHQTLDLFNANREAWTNLLKGGTARPVEVPWAVVTEVRSDEDGVSDADATAEAELLLLGFDVRWEFLR